MSITTADKASVRRQQLLELLLTAREHGVRIARVSEVDALVKQRTPAWFLKHDVHGLRLESLLEFAQAEQNIGVLATYLFMDGDHPITQRQYAFDAQVDAMRQIQAMGHEVGLHIDPLHLICNRSVPLKSAMMEIIRRFASEGIRFAIGNAHGNTKFNIRDRNGHSSLFEFFDELAHHHDFPVLANLTDETAALVRANRVSITELGFCYWADMPLWSQANRCIVMHYITDNFLGKQGTVRISTMADAVGRYKLMHRSLPPAVLIDPALLPTMKGLTDSVREFVDCQSPDGPADPLPIGVFNIALDSPECRDWFLRLASEPALMLIHPEHYC